MANFRKDNKIRKMEQRIKSFETNNPDKAKRLKGKLAAFKSKKE